MSRFFRPLKQSGPRPTPAKSGPGESAGPTQETTAKWPEAGPSGPAAYNRKTQWPVVKRHAVTKGLPT